MINITQSVSKELNVTETQVTTVIDMLNEGNTIPFIARYRKERTGNLDEVELRAVRDRFEYLTELEDRRSTILNSIDEQGKLTDELKKEILKATTKQTLEDLYLPYKPKKRTRAIIAKEMGLEPLAELIRDQQAYQEWLTLFVTENTHELDEENSLARARDIVAEWISEDAEIRDAIRSIIWQQGIIKTEVYKAFAEQKTKFEQYYDHAEPVSSIPAHRYLAIRRAEEESIIRVKIEAPMEILLDKITSKWIDPKKSNQEQVLLSAEDGLNRLILPSIEVDIRLNLKNEADEESIAIFNDNLKNLLLAPLGGTKTILGVDPAYVSGTKWVVVEKTGKFIEKGIIYPVPPQNRIEQAKEALKKLIKKYDFDYICIGNGTASREIMQFTKSFLKEINNTKSEAIFVNESGASVYSASETAREEFPELDVSYRGAISIARRFQDPLAELVKIDPKSIGVGQYQHDVNQRKLKKSLDEVVESCVNYVGVNLNTASASILGYVSGLNKTLAKNIISFRDENGEFAARSDLLKVPRFGPKSFQQSAGFLRIRNSGNPLDQSAVHPENYDIVEKMAADVGVSVSELVGKLETLDQIDISNYQTEDAGLLTLRDIIDELKKPGRDPRTSYVGAKLDDQIQTIEDLAPDMVLEGTITNLTKFGAFVDLGVHQDGLIHISEMANHYIKEASEVCKVGQIVKVKILDVDISRKRIALSMKQVGGDGADSETLPQKKKIYSQGNKDKYNKDIKTIKQKQTKMVATQANKEKPKKLSGNMKTDLEALANKFKGL
ncbi:MAG: RNA-binding transcriptional accessory protein [Deltaproteobacteria bacterium]|jgi:protein Tex|nr:RNA-binding transcriptional accessory protein [Deltaproteobacteria bacterium]MBT4526583.1 RNA-binding transcriptional accessory protein [Deltaproteobacteria bacterium]